VELVDREDWAVVVVAVVHALLKAPLVHLAILAQMAQTVRVVP